MIKIQVKAILQEFFMKDLQNLAQILQVSTKNETFLARYKTSCKTL